MKKHFGFMEKVDYYTIENPLGLTDFGIKHGLVSKTRPFKKGARISKYGKYRFRKKYGSKFR